MTFMMAKYDLTFKAASRSDDSLDSLQIYVGLLWLKPDQASIQIGHLLEKLANMIPQAKETLGNRIYL